MDNGRQQDGRFAPRRRSHDGFFLSGMTFAASGGLTARGHYGFTFKPSLAAAFRWRSSKLKNTFVSKTSAAAMCNRSKLRVPSVGKGYHS